MKQKPMVSVLCLSMNHEQFIEKSFISLIHQTYTNFEIFYADNCSDDNSFEKGEMILQQGSLTYKAFKRERPFSSSENLNFLLKHATGKYITILSADDWWDRSNLAEKINYFEKNPQYGFLHGSGYLYFHDTGVAEPEKVISKKTGWVFKDLLRRNFINTIGIVIKKEVLDIVGPFDEQSPLEDWDMWLRLAIQSQLGFHNKRLVYYGKQSGNISNNKAFMATGYEYIFSKYSSYPEINVARKFYKMVDVYEAAVKQPGVKGLFLLMRNFDFSLLHVKQMAKAMLDGIKNKKL